jgi:periplasmic glucans biosynthesis protein
LYRRDFLAASLAVAPWLVAGMSAPLSPAAAGPRMAEPQPFSVGWLRERARTLGAAAYEAPGNTLPPPIADLSYDEFRDIRYKPERALWLDADLPFTAQFYHLGSYYRTPVRIHEVVDNVAREIQFSQELFNYGNNGFEEPLPADLGFAGFRLHFPINRPDYRDEVAVFLGASYFRAVGRYQQYGLSARGLAIDTGLPKGEEFPAFREFWLERPTPGGTEMKVHALLDSPSLAGAYSFVIRPGETTVTEVSAALFPRQPIERLGVAPMTSMYLFGPNDRIGVDDFRPQVHDSDGLSIWRGSGEWVWRPLVNPQRLQLSVFGDQNPRGFGLLQRERDFEGYQDLEAHYERRPSVWVEPANDWGKGAVLLIELPTDEEIHDNIVAFWVPEEQILPGTEWNLDYRLHWARIAPQRTNLAEVVATRVGSGATPGADGEEGLRKFVIEFVGGPLASLEAKAAVEPVVTASKGELLKPVTHRNPMTGGWRLFFDFRPEGEGPAELRSFLKLGESVLTESWSYQWTA